MTWTAFAAPAQAGRPLGPACDEIDWKASLSAARLEAEQRQSPILIYFWLDGSSFCQQMYADTLTTDQGLAELANFVCVSAPADRSDARELVQRFGVSTLPTLVFVDARGEAQDAIEGFMALPRFLEESARVRRGEGTVSDWRRKAQASPDDLDVRLRLALQLEHVGQVDECEALLDSIKKEDPDGDTVAGAQLRLYDVFDVVLDTASDRSDPRTYELAPLYEHMPHVKPKPILFEGWRWILDVEQQRGDRPKERAAWIAVWEHAPDEQQRLTHGVSMLKRFFELEIELSTEERRLTNEIVEQLEEAAVAHPGRIKDEYIHHARALALAINGDRHGALAEAEKALALNPDDPQHQRLRDLLQ